MSEPQKKPGWTFWTTVALVVVLVGYPLSFGPACWITSRIAPSGEVVSAVYWPLFAMLPHLPQSVRIAVGHYIQRGTGGKNVIINDGVRFLD